MLTCRLLADLDIDSLKHGLGEAAKSCTQFAGHPIGWLRVGRKPMRLCYCGQISHEKVQR